MTSVAELLASAPLPRLDDGAPAEALSPIDLQARLDAAQAAPIVRGVLHLRHGHLREAHDLAQQVGGPLGDWLHALMHRMEGDYGNALYWHARAGGQGRASGGLTRRIQNLGGAFDSAQAAELARAHAAELDLLAQAALNEGQGSSAAT